MFLSPCFTYAGFHCCNNKVAAERNGAKEGPADWGRVQPRLTFYAPLQHCWRLKYTLKGALSVEVGKKVVAKRNDTTAGRWRSYAHSYFNCSWAHKAIGLHLHCDGCYGSSELHSTTMLQPGQYLVVSPDIKLIMEPSSCTPTRAGSPKRRFSDSPGSGEQQRFPNQ